jgi:uncharacterized protein YjiS (DUF1127 family)
MLKKFIDWFNNYQEKRVAYIQLTSLSDKQLRDLGITRSEIVEKIYGREKIQS